MPNPNIPAVDPNRKAEYRRQLEANIAAIQQVIPDFHLTEEQKDAYLSDKRIMLHDQAKENFDGRLAADKKLKSIAKLPRSFDRAFLNMVDPSGTPKAEEYNLELKRELSDPANSKSGKKQEFLMDIINDVAELDPDQVDFRTPLEDRMEYILKHEAALRQGFILMGSTLDEVGLKELNLKIRPDQAGNIRKIGEFGEIVGGNGTSQIDMLRTDAFLVFPHEHLSPEQVLLIQASAKVEKNIINPASHMAQAQILSAEQKPEKSFSSIEHGVFEHRSPVYGDEIELTDVVTVRNGFKQFYQELKEQSGRFSRNSDQYTNLLQSLEQMDKAFNNALDENNVLAGDTDELFDKMKKVQSSAYAYLSHIGKKAKNSRQASRQEITDKIEKLTSAVIGSGSQEMFDQSVEYMNRHNFENRQAAAEATLSPEINAQEKAFQAAAKAADHARTKVEAMPEGSAKQIRQFIQEQRDSLLDMAGNGRKNPDLQELQTKLASVYVGAGLTDEQLSTMNVDRFRKAAEKTAASPAFREMTANLTTASLAASLQPENIHKFMTNFSQKLKQDPTQRPRSNSASIKKKEASAQKAEPKKTSKDDMTLGM